MEGGVTSGSAGLDVGQTSYSGFQEAESGEVCSTIEEPSDDEEGYWSGPEAGFPLIKRRTADSQLSNSWVENDAEGASSAFATGHSVGQSLRGAAGGEMRGSEQQGSAGENATSTLDETTGEPPVLLITTVDIGEGRSDRIEVRAGENTMSAARRFCSKHGLPEEVVEPLSRHLIDNLSSLVDKKERDDAQLAKARVTKAAPKMRSSAPTRRSTAASHERPAFDRLHRSNADARRRTLEPSWTPDFQSGGGKPRTNGQVFDRLYALAEETRSKKEALAAQHEEEARMQVEAQRESIGWVSRELAASRTVGEYLNYGERLYVEGVVERERKLQEALMRKEEEASQELDGVTFKPEISKMAQRIHRPKDLSTWERLSVGYSNQKPMLEARMQMMRLEDKAKEVEECTFAPKINRQSKRMMNQRTEVLREHRITAHEQLFQDAIRRQLRQDEYSEWYPEEVTFQPTVNPPQAWKRASMAASRASVATRSSARQPLDQQHEGFDRAVRVDVWADSRDESAAGCRLGLSTASESNVSVISNNFGDRLYARRDEKQKKLAAVAASLQPKFKPKTGRAPKGRNLGRKSVGEYLYAKHHEIESKKEYMTEQQRQQQQQQSSRPHTSGHSQALMEKLKKRRFQQIFAFLDQDGSNAVDLVGIVVSEGEFLSQLQSEAREDVVEAARLLQARRDAFARRCQQDRSIAPEEIPEVLLVDAEGFSALMDEVLRSHRGHPRAYLQPASVSSRMDMPEHTFQPELARKSKALAVKRRPKNVPAYEMMLQEHQQAQHRRELQKAAREDAELAECTFEPQFISVPLSQAGRLSHSINSENSAPSSRTIGVSNSTRRRLLESDFNAPRQAQSVTSATASLFELAGMTNESVLNDTSLEYSHDLLLQLEAAARGDGYEPDISMDEEAKPHQREGNVGPSLMHAEQEDVRPQEFFTSSYAFDDKKNDGVSGAWPLEKVVDTDSDEEEASGSSMRGWTPQQSNNKIVQNLQGAYRY